MDRKLGKPLSVSNSDGEQVTLFAVVTADPCPTIQWRLNGSAVSDGENYEISDPCSGAPAGTTSFNFSLTITVTSATTGTYNATLTNAAETTEVPDVFVTPPGSCAGSLLLSWWLSFTDVSCFMQFQWLLLSSRFPAAC